MIQHPIDQVGGPSVIAQRLGISQPSVTQWRMRGVPIERCVQIEQAFDGVVRRWHLRPNDWHRIWPELIGIEGAPAIAGTSEQEQQHAA
jgi:DNA-binding transcriptional regulator YdaS (Cro superfamily)